MPSMSGMLMSIRITSGQDLRRLRDRLGTPEDAAPTTSMSGSKPQELGEVVASLRNVVDDEDPDPAASQLASVTPEVAERPIARPLAVAVRRRVAAGCATRESSLARSAGMIAAIGWKNAVDRHELLEGDPRGGDVRGVVRPGPSAEPGRG